MSYIQTSTNEVELDEDEITDTTTNIRPKKDCRRLLFGVSIATCLVLVAVTVIIIVGFESKFNSNNITKGEELVNVIMEEPTQCLMDVNCTSFAFDNAEISRIRRIFNEYDGDNDDLWAKEEFIRFYIESIEGGGKSDSFAVMDLNNDSVWSYKEAIIYFLMLSELSSVQNIMFPLFQNIIQDIYNYNTTIYHDQLFWEYVAEITFVEFDDYQQGFITKENYLKRVAALEFDLFAKNDPDHETITFDEFLDSRFSQQALDNFVTTDIDALTAEYKHLQSELLNNTNIDQLLSGLQLQHCLYSGTDFENIRRRLASGWDCIWAVVGCTGAAVATVAGCVAGVAGCVATVAGCVIVIIGCAGGSTAAMAGCYGAARVCQAYLDTRVKK